MNRGEEKKIPGLCLRCIANSKCRRKIVLVQPFTFCFMINIHILCTLFVWPVMCRVFSFLFSFFFCTFKIFTCIWESLLYSHYMLCSFSFDYIFYVLDYGAVSFAWLHFIYANIGIAIAVQPITYRMKKQSKKTNKEK